MLTILAPETPWTERVAPLSEALLINKLPDELSENL